MATVYKDKRYVHLLSTNQPPGMTGGDNPKPIVIAEYNKYMGGVDKSDQMRSYYGIGNHSKKWWRCVFSFILNLCIVQAWITWKNSCHNPVRNASYCHLFFRGDVADQLRAGFVGKKMKVGREARSIVIPVDSIDHHKLMKRAGEKRTCRQYSKMGKKTASNNTPRSSFFCKFCDLNLCRGACFRDWHDLNIRQAPPSQ